MGLREWANQHPKLAASLVSLCVVVCVGFMIVEMLGDRRPKIGVLPEHYFTVDDGKTVFTANGANIPPFQYQGKTAVRAYMFEADGKRFVGYLMRYTPEAQKAEIAKTITPQQEVEGREVKKPGDANWVSTGNHAAKAKVMKIESPAGSAAIPMPVEP